MGPTAEVMNPGSGDLSRSFEIPRTHIHTSTSPFITSIPLHGIAFWGELSLLTTFSFFLHLYHMFFYRFSSALQFNYAVFKRGTPAL